MNDVDKKLLTLGRLDLCGEVCRDMSIYVREALITKISEGSPELTIHLTSGGGRVSWGLDIHDMLKFYPGKKIGIVHGIAASMAAIILQACDWRVATPHSKIVIHHISSQDVTLDTLRDPDKMKRFTDGMESDQTKLYNILISSTKKSLDEIRATCALDMPMGAEEAKTYGLIDQVIVVPSEIVQPKKT